MLLGSENRMREERKIWAAVEGKSFSARHT